MVESPLAVRIKERIDRDGPLSFAQFMAIALYDPRLGFYMGPRRRAGRGEDFVTAPTYSDVFGRTLAAMVPRLHRALGEPRWIRLIDAGGGGGELLRPLARRVRGLLPGVELEAVLVERGQARRAVAEALVSDHCDAGIHWRWVTECADLSRLEPMPGFIVANELFDALPVRRLRRAGDQIEELSIEVAGGRLREVWRNVSLVLDGRRLPVARESTLALGVEELMLALGAGISDGALLIIDYGYPARILDAWDGPGSPVRGFRGGVLVDDLLAQPGETDLTASVDFSRLDRAAAAAGWRRLLFTDQYQLLLGLGFLDDPDAARAKRLVHPEDMGGAFKCLVEGRGLELAALGLGLARDRSRLL